MIKNSWLLRADRVWCLHCLACCSEVQPLLQSISSVRPDSEARQCDDMTTSQASPALSRLSSGSPPQGDGETLTMNFPLWLTDCYICLRRRTGGVWAVSSHPSSWLLQPGQGSSPRWDYLLLLILILILIWLSDYLHGTEGDSEDFENGFFFPEPPSPNLFTEAPTPEFIGKTESGI